MSQTLTTLQVVKRDGRIVPFDRSRIVRAVERCLAECDDDPSLPDPRDVADDVEASDDVIDGVSVEQIQDLVEKILMGRRAFLAAKRYVLYRAEHAKLRDERPIPDDVKTAFAADEEFFPTPLQRFVYLDRYARWSDGKGRRETWVETVDRVVAALRKLAGTTVDDATYDRIRLSILEMKSMPSMRLLAMAGPAFDRSSMVQFNCSYLPISDLLAFKEILLLSMHGVGVGYSVERQFTDQLPMVEPKVRRNSSLWVVEDSTEGWGEALAYGLDEWFSGFDVKFDYSMVREAGTPLKTKGGRASGSGPLERLLAFARARILARQGKRLRPIDAHDIACAIGNAVISGGVRRTALISLFDQDDQDMLHAKDGDFETLNSQRWNANNSMVWPNPAAMDQVEFIDRFMAMVKSGRGEPGIFSRDNAHRLMPKHRDKNYQHGNNPCGEAELRPFGLCNLSAAIARSDDTFDSLRDKVEIATIIGTIQSLATNFPGFRPEWKKHAEEERLLGVDITGQMDCPMLVGPNGPVVLETLREHAWQTNRYWSDRFSIPVSASITVNKPSGNTSQLVNCSSGLHARWAPYYIRNVRLSAGSPIARVLQDAGVPLSPENGDDPANPRTLVASFPVKSPDGAITRNDRSAVEQCEYWKRNKLHWTTHNPSVTVTYRPDEVIDVMQWVWENREIIGGMAFLPSSDANYAQLPYIEIDQAEYERRVAEFPEIQWDRLFRYEQLDTTTSAQELACSSGLCSLE